MSALSNPKTRTEVYSVTKLCRELEEVLSHTYKSISLRGEVSDLFKAVSGHRYFTVKDDQSIFAAVMFRFAAERMTEPLENGKEYIFQGTVRVYGKRGQLQFDVVRAEAAGLGNLHLTFERLKQKLAQEGLFEESIKKPLPFLPGLIGIITSPTGAVIHDMETVIRRKFPHANLELFPTKVQGNGAAKQMITGIDYFNAQHKADVIIIARGGGSFEDLAEFNDEALARCIAGSEVPIISAVGHETDFTICDFVADRRAATPTAAAETVVPDVQDLIQHLSGSRKRLIDLIQRQIKDRRAQLVVLQYELSDPALSLRTNYRRLDEQYTALIAQMRRHIETKQGRLQTLQKRVSTASPLSKIRKQQRYISEQQLTLRRRIYNVTYRYKNTLLRNIDRLELHNPVTFLRKGFITLRKEQGGEKIRSVKELSKADAIRIEMADGVITGRVTGVETFPNVPPQIDSTAEPT